MNWNITPLETIAALSSLVSVVLATRAKALTWPTGIIGCIAYATLFWQIKLYADFGLQFVFIAQSLYGWHLWRQSWQNPARLAEPSVAIHSATKFEIRASLIFMILFAPALALALHNFTDASLPWVDSILATISLIATWLLARKSLANWYLWILADIGYICLFYYKGLAVSSVLYFIFLVLCIHGLLHWRALLASSTVASASPTNPYSGPAPAGTQAPPPSQNSPAI